MRFVELKVTTRRKLPDGVILTFSNPISSKVPVFPLMVTEVSTWLSTFVCAVAEQKKSGAKNRRTRINLNDFIEMNFLMQHTKITDCFL
jgi:hypothetical protein